MSLWRMVSRCAVMLAAMPCLALLRAQEVNATIHGTVIDQRGNYLFGASVTVTNTETKAHTPARNNMAPLSRQYFVGPLPSGYYTVTFSHDKFKNLVQENVRLHDHEDLILNSRMTPGSETETVTLVQQPPVGVPVDVMTGGCGPGEAVERTAVGARVPYPDPPPPPEHSIEGRVTNTKGEGVGAALVYATNTDTGTQTTCITEPSGAYRIWPIEPGPYNMEVAAKGYSWFLQEDVRVPAKEPYIFHLKAQDLSWLQRATDTPGYLTPEPPEPASPPDPAK